MPRPDAALMMAARLEAAHPAVDRALADAQINLDQAHVIVGAVDALPPDLVDADTRDKAEAFLLHDARQRRFHSKAQRIALGLRDGGCTAEGCDRSPSHCDAHHDVAWSKCGSTDVKTGRLFCQRHHTLAHDRRYQLKAGPNGKVSFTRRAVSLRGCSNDGLPWSVPVHAQRHERTSCTMPTTHLTGAEPD